jgi:hypothetical protein
MEQLSSSLILFVVLTAAIALFIDEISSQVKRTWDNLFLRHAGLMFFRGFFGFAYEYNLQDDLKFLLDKFKLIALLISSYIPLFQSKLLIAAALLHFVISLLIVVCFCGIYFVLRRKKYTHPLGMLWAFWLIIATLQLAG